MLCSAVRVPAAFSLSPRAEQLCFEGLSGGLGSSGGHRSLFCGFFHLIQTAPWVLRCGFEFCLCVWTAHLSW